MKKCCLFFYPTVEEAVKNMRFELVEEYGKTFYNSDGTEKHNLHKWDAGQRALVRCTSCGALYLRQLSEFHDTIGGSNCYYTDYYQVESREEALSINEEYDGSNLDKEFSGPTIKRSNTNSMEKWQWSE